MANYNPNTSGLVSLADRPDNERTKIQSQGGIASGKKRRELKRMSEIIQGIREGSEQDPVETVIKTLFSELNSFDASTSDIIKGLNFIRGMEINDDLHARKIIYKYITQKEQQEVEEHIKAVINDTS